MATTIRRDAQGRITSYKATSAPSQARLRAILREGEKRGARKVGLVGNVREFRGYESKKGWDGLVRDFRNTPAQLAARISTKGESSQHATANILKELGHASQAESVGGLKDFQLNFIY